MNITAIILTYNEQLHIARCIENVKKITNKIIIVDSYSTDMTLSIAEKYDVKILQNVWVNHAVQFNWALSELNESCEWVLRVDADEILTDELIDEIKCKIPKINDKISGVYFRRRISFQGRVIKHGGVFPVTVLRLFRRGSGRCELRWMDEHIMVKGDTIIFKNEILDDNLNFLTWWIEKHNNYASREAYDMLNYKYRMACYEDLTRVINAGSVSKKRWVKENIYIRIPGGLRAVIYFVYRYVIRFGFLDGYEGLLFHVFQGLWYRILVDAKISEVYRYKDKNNVDIQDAVEIVLGIMTK